MHEHFFDMNDYLNREGNVRFDIPIAPPIGPPPGGAPLPPTEGDVAPEPESPYIAPAPAPTPVENAAEPSTTPADNEALSGPNSTGDAAAGEKLVNDAIADGVIDDGERPMFETENPHLDVVFQKSLGYGRGLEMSEIGETLTPQAQEFLERDLAGRTISNPYDQGRWDRLHDRNAADAGRRRLVGALEAMNISESDPARRAEHQAMIAQLMPNDVDGDMDFEAN